jgi:hypothetical protein
MHPPSFPALISRRAFSTCKPLQYRSNIRGTPIPRPESPLPTFRAATEWYLSQSTDQRPIYLDEARFLARVDANRKSQAFRNRNGRGGYRGSLKGHGPDSERTTASRQLSWILRHGAKNEGLAIREDGFVRVNELVSVLFRVLDITRFAERRYWTAQAPIVPPFGPPIA